MGCDLLAALGSATTNRHTLMGLQRFGSEQAGQSLQRFPGREHANDEMYRLPGLEIPQGRQTFTVVGHQPYGFWGLSHGANDRGLAIGLGAWRSKLASDAVGPLGPDLVRLALERCKTARASLDFITEIVGRLGAGPSDQIFLFADPHESYILETAGKHWAWMECQQARAVSDLGFIRQDWQKLSPGLAELVIHRGWWPDDGNKLDFAGSLSPAPRESDWAYKRLGRGTKLLEEQNGAIDVQSMRRMLEDQFEATIATHTTPGRDDFPRLEASCIVDLYPDSAIGPMLWWSLGPSSQPLYLPIFLQGDLPDALRLPGLLTEPLRRLDQELEETPTSVAMETMLGRLQARFDQEGESLYLAGLRGVDPVRFSEDATNLMRNHVEAIENEVRQAVHTGPRRRVRDGLPTSL